MLSQHYFKLYGENKQDIEKSLQNLVSEGIIKDYKYEGIVGYEQATFNNSITNTISNNISFNNSVKTGEINLSNEFKSNFSRVNAIGFDSEYPTDRRGLK